MSLLTKSLLGIYALPSIGTAATSFAPIYRHRLCEDSNRFEKVILFAMTIPVALINGAIWPIYWGTHLLDEK
jgi:hypothetical protein